jgi:hypothetical protein
MKRAFLAVIAVSLLAVGSMTTGQAPNPPRREFLSVLKPKQSILLKDIGGRFTVSLIDELPDGLTHKVVEVGADYIAVEDVSGLQQTRIPIWSITSIIRIKTAKN